MMEAGTNVGMGHHEVDEGDPNQAVGEEEAGGEIGIEEGTETEKGEIDRGILVGRREVVREVVLDGTRGRGHDHKFPNFKTFCWFRQFPENPSNGKKCFVVTSLFLCLRLLV